MILGENMLIREHQYLTSEKKANLKSCQVLNIKDPKCDIPCKAKIHLYKTLETK